MIHERDFADHMTRQTAALEALADQVAKLANPVFTLLAEGAATHAQKEHERWKDARYYRVAELAGAALGVSLEAGGRIAALHKQWFLEQIYEALGLDPSLIKHEPGIAP